MPTLSDTTDAMNSNDGLQAALRLVAARLNSTELVELAHAISKSYSAASRIRSGESKVSIEDAVQLLYAVGLKVVPAEKACVDRAAYEAMATIATRAMANPKIAQQLVWGDA